ncbi:MAG TPA: histidine kinase dimerization/phosphoacceptor domain-containing protein [Anaerolineales bacterium]
MTRKAWVRGYQGSYLIGFIMIAVVAMRTIILYRSQSALPTASLFLTAYCLLYATEPLLSNRLRWYHFLYFPLQTGLVIALTNLRPFTDISNLLYLPLCVRAVRSFSRRAAVAWLVLYTLLLSTTLIVGMAWLEGLSVFLLFLAVCGFLVSYDLLYDRTQNDQVKSQALLADLHTAHQKLKEYADQAEELAAARERNRLARELHDTVSQWIFSITLSARSAQLLLESDPARVPEQLERLQDMTANALSQLRSLITQLRPSQKS